MVIVSLKNIGDMFREYCAVFVSFFLVLSVTFGCLLVMSAYNHELLERGNAVNTEARTYVLRGDIAAGEERQMVERICESLPEHTLESVLYIAREPVTWNGTDIRIGMSASVDERQVALDRGTLSWSGTDRAEMIVNDLYYRSSGAAEGIDDTVQLDGTKVVIRAIGHLRDAALDAIVNPAGYRSLQTDTSEIHMVWERRLSASEQERLTQASGDSYTWEMPDRYHTATASQFLHRLLLVGGMLFLAVTNVMGLYRYLIMRRRKEFLIYRIFGIGRGKMAGMILTELLLLSTAGYLLGAGGAALLLRWFGGSLWTRVDIGLFVRDYLAGTASALVSAIPVLRMTGTHRLAQKYGREEMR